MSVSGLYDSIEGDRLAQKSLAPYCHHHYQQSTKRRRKKCACGSETARPYIQRAGVRVCTQCATKPRLPGGHPAINKCAKCKKTFARVAMVMRNGKTHCKACARGL